VACRGRSVVAESPYRWYWRDYRGATGSNPIAEFLSDLSREDRLSIAVAMKRVRRDGVRGGRHLRGDLYEMRAHAQRAHYRVIFSQESRRVMLALLIYDKNTDKTPERIVELATQRLQDWRQRGRRA
jgi:phage-related protein